jgi:hypothetical protein
MEAEEMELGATQWQHQSHESSNELGVGWRTRRTREEVRSARTPATRPSTKTSRARDLRLAAMTNARQLDDGPHLDLTRHEPEPLSFLFFRETDSSNAQPTSEENDAGIRPQSSH